MLARLRSLAKGVLVRSRIERDMAEEFKFHLERRVEDLTRTGVPPAEAARLARLEFGGGESYKEECREGPRTPVLRRIRTGPPLCVSHAEEQSRLRYRSDPVSGARHRSEHRHLFPARRGAAEIIACLEAWRIVADQHRWRGGRGPQQYFLSHVPTIPGSGACPEHASRHEQGRVAEHARARRARVHAGLWASSSPANTSRRLESIPNAAACSLPKITG